MLAILLDCVSCDMVKIDHTSRFNKKNMFQNYSSQPCCYHTHSFVYGNNRLMKSFKRIWQCSWPGHVFEKISFSPKSYENFELHVLEQQQMHNGGLFGLPNHLHGYNKHVIMYIALS